MVILELPLIGDGTQLAPYTVSLPTFRMLDVDYVAMSAIVEVPDELAPPEVVEGATTRAVPNLATPVVHELGQQALDLWYEHLDTMYAEHAGEFRPEPARAFKAGSTLGDVKPPEPVSPLVLP